MKNNLLSRIITGIVFFFLSILFIFYEGIVNGDYFAIALGIFFLIIAFFIFLNKNEDSIEEIKDK